MPCLLQGRAICSETKVLQLIMSAAWGHKAEVLVQAVVEAADTRVPFSLEAFARLAKPCLGSSSLGRDFRLQQHQVPHVIVQTVQMIHVATSQHPVRAVQVTRLGVHPQHA